ncbi:MAG: site-specific integrase [Acidobacteria bacterium]|nr:site-specific integrase [Acidobacteriota bacterium]
MTRAKSTLGASKPGSGKMAPSNEESVMAVFKRSERWRFRLQIRGVRYARPVPEATTKKQAQAAETRFKNELLQGRYDLVDQARMDTTLSQYSKQYLNWSEEHKKSFKDDRTNMAVLVVHFGSKRLSDISPIDVERFKIERRKTPTRRGTTRAAATVNRELALLRHVLTMALRDGLIRDHPMKSGKVRLYREDNKVERFLNEEEEAQLLLACVGRYAHLRPIIVTALYTGMRRGEVFNLKWSDVDLDRNQIHVRKSKTGKPRTIHITPNVHSVIEQLLPLTAESEFVFGNPNTGKARTDSKHGFTAVCRAAGIAGLRFHDLRHTFATRLARSSGNIVDVAHVLGHAQISTTMRYAHAIPDKVAAAMDRLAMPERKAVSLPMRESKSAV